jgi:hypothetical protein
MDSPQRVLIILTKSEYKLRMPIESVVSHLQTKDCQVTTI